MGEWEEHHADVEGPAFSTGYLGLNVCQHCRRKSKRKKKKVLSGRVEYDECTEAREGIEKVNQALFIRFGVKACLDLFLKGSNRLPSAPTKQKRSCNESILKKLKLDHGIRGSLIAKLHALKVPGNLLR